MKGLILSTYLWAALAAPAVVWKSSRQSGRVLHSSDDLKSSELLENALNVEASDSSLAAVVFLLGKADDGSESLSELASAGKLPNTASKYDEADAFYHHVSGIESTNTMVKEASRANPAHRVLLISLSELNSKLTSLKEPTAEVEMEISENGAMMSKTVKHANKRARELAKANVLLVQIDPKHSDASEIDSAIVKAIEHESIENVILAGIRSLNEVKHERNLLSKRRMDVMEAQGQRVLQAKRRRLDQEDQGEEDQGDNNQYYGDNGEDMTGVYYVSMTPNILAGILFGLLFFVVTWIGLTCMGEIASQDVYVKKMPIIGREA